MAGGFAKDCAVQDQIDATINDAINRAHEQRLRGASLKNCEECNSDIPAARRDAVPGVRLCVACRGQHDSEATNHSGYNRRGSKDSQLR